MTSITPKRLVGIVCAAQVLVQIGAFFWPALLPGMMPLWGLTNSEAGWITAIFYAAYMVSVPILVTLTDKYDAKFVYLFGVAATIVGHLAFGWLAEGFWSALATRAITGLGWAGTYMTGLKLLADVVDAKMMSRATAGHAASIGISGALSFACADLIASAGGWRAAFLVAGTTAAIAWIMVATLVPKREKKPAPPADGQGPFQLPARFQEPLGDGLCARLLHPYPRNERITRMGRGFPRLCGGEHGNASRRGVADTRHHGPRADRNICQCRGQRGSHQTRPALADRRGDDGLDRDRRHSGLRRHDVLLAGRGAVADLRPRRLARTRPRSPRVPQGRRNPRGAAQPSPFTRCSATRAASSGR